MKIRDRGRPPASAAWLLARLSAYQRLFEMAGEVEDEFHELKAARGVFRARAWFWAQTIRALGSYGALSLSMGSNMLKNYLKIAARNLLRHKGFSLINVFGLSAGLACCMIIFLYVHNELTYDDYHDDASRCFRVAEYRLIPSREIRSALVSGAVGPTIRSDFPQVECAACLYPLRNGLVQSGNARHYEDRIYYADQEIFEIFKIPFRSGDPAAALTRPRTVVISNRIAEKYFGDENPLGRILQLKDPRVMRRGEESPQPVDYEITGVAADPPSNTHFKYDLIASAKIFEKTRIPTEWDNHSAYLYIKLLPGIEWRGFEKRIAGLADTYYGENLKKWGQERKYFLQPLRSIHFRSDLQGAGFRGATGEMEPPGSMLYVYVYSSIGLLILLIGCMNFVNISNARSVYRIKEIGLRKVVGARRSQLVRQLLGESVIITVISLIVACVLFKALLPLFNQTAGVDLKVADLLQPVVLLAVFALTGLTAFVAGGYPAFVLTSFKPSVILRGASTAGTGGANFLRSLVLLQFAISIFLAVGVVTVYQQLSFMKGEHLGFDVKRKLVLPFRDNIQVRRNHQTLKNEFLRCPGIDGATVTANVPGRHITTNSIRFPGERNDQQRLVRFLACDEEFFDVYRIEMAVGRAFEKGRNDKRDAFVINRSAARILGFDSPEEAVGKLIREGFSQHRKTIIGVTEDFHLTGMRSEIEPLLMEYSDLPFLYNTLTLSVDTRDLPRTLAEIESRWSALYPDIPYEGFFLDDDFRLQYRTEEQVGRLLSVIAGMGLSIACLGLLGLSIFLAKKRTKEIGIRKIMGASAPSIAGLLSRQFILLVAAANLVAGPAAYFVMNRWLQGFAFRISLGWPTFAAAGLGTLIITGLTVALQALKAAGSNPVDALRYE